MNFLTKCQRPILQPIILLHRTYNLINAKLKALLSILFSQVHEF